MFSDMSPAVLGLIVFLALAAVALLVVLVVVLVRKGNNVKTDPVLAAQIQQIIQAQTAQQAAQATQQAQIGEIIARNGDNLRDSLSAQLAINAKTVSDSQSALHERLGSVDTAQHNMMKIAESIGSLQKVLDNKQARGAFGETQLELIVDNLFPSKLRNYQVTLSNGKRADCVIDLPSPPGPMAIDAKFPLENFNGFIDASTDVARKTAQKLFETSVRLHAKAIAEKYIIPGETADSAFMFVPSEAIFSAIHEHCQDAVREAIRLHVWIVSPSTLGAVLLTLKGALTNVSIANRGAEIRHELTKLFDDMTRLEDRVTKLVRHHQMVEEDMRAVVISMEKIQRRAQNLIGETAENPALVVPPPGDNT